MSALATLCGQGSVEPCQSYVLLGDPATRLALRAVGPPENVQALAGNDRVDLSWDPSSTPDAEYDVYRSESLVVPFYRKLNGERITGTTFADTDVDNAVTYYYYLIATDPDEFVSRFSHFNTDCDVDGPDCLKATPLNPNPPDPPANLSVEDPGLGDTLLLSWDPPSEDDLAYYTVRYGTEPGVHPYSDTAPVGSSYTLDGLDEGQLYYLVVTATNTSGRTSGLSDEVSDFPVVAFGLRQPRYIDDLTVIAAHPHIELHWSEVTNDIYGKPEQVTRYQIFRGSSPAFDNESLGPPIAECFSPCTSYQDANALTSPDSYHYRVRAVDVDENVGGLGADPPGITTLQIGRSLGTPGDLALDWTPVVTRIDGGPVDLSHYEVYASDLPFTRVDVRNGSIPLLLIHSGTGLEFSPQTQDRYYSVLAVDRQGNRSPF
jgi:hypothetical protein